jgi:hypothetical protein
MALTTFVAGNVLTAAQLNDSFAAVGGLRATVPTSATVTGAGSSATVGTHGKVTFATAASLSINGCFSASFTNYRVIIDFDSAGTLNVDARLRVGGADNTTASSYIWQGLGANNTTISGTRVTTTSWRLGGASTYATNAMSLDVYRPFEADTTAFYVIGANSNSGALLDVNCGTHNQNTSYDGFTLIPTSSTISGTVTVYGYFG